MIVMVAFILTPFIVGLLIGALIAALFVVKVVAVIVAIVLAILLVSLWQGREAPAEGGLIFALINIFCGGILVGAGVVCGWLYPDVWIWLWNGFTTTVRSVLR